MDMIISDTTVQNAEVTIEENKMDNINRQAAIDVVEGGAELIRRVLDNMDVVIGERSKFAFGLGLLESCIEELSELPSAQSESWEDERKKIANALSEKMAYMNTCLNERDVILGYLGVKRPNETHCNSDCQNEKCESYHYETRKQPAPCDLCSNLEKGDTLYQYSDWDGGIGFDYIRDIQYCPKCGRRL